MGSNKGAWEYKMQQRAYEAVTSLTVEEQSSFALVPALSSSCEVNLGETTRVELENKFLTSLTKEKSLLIAMECVEGEDLATIFYKWILERERLFSAEDVDGMTFKQLYQEVSDRLGFQSLSNESIDDPRALELAEWKNSAENTAKLYAYLRKNKFPFPTKMITQVDNTIKLLHTNHITHGDVFERNVMVTGGMKVLRSKGTLEDQKSYLIDFGEAQDHFVEGVDEFALIRRLNSLTLSKEDEDRSIREKGIKDFELKWNLLRTRDKNWKNLYEKVRVAATNNSEEGLKIAWNGTAAMDQAFLERFFALAKEGVTNNLFSKDEVTRFLGDKITKLTTYYQGVARESLAWINQ